MSGDLATKLRTGTQHSHTAAEHTGFMKRFLQGTVDKQILGQLLGNLYAIYSHLEAALERHQTDPLIRPLYFPQLNRTANLEEDLTFYYGENWREQLHPTAAAQAYIHRIQCLSATQPALLLAHAYTRYMGDLSGGQMLARIAQKALSLEEHEGIRFYDFDDIADANEFKVQYRDALNQLPIDDILVDQLVAEANTAFSLNISLLRELETQELVPA